MSDSIALIWLTLLAATAHAQRIDIRPTTLLAGKPLSIELADLQPGQTVVLTSERTVREFTGQTRRFRAQSRFVADAKGRVNLATQAPAASSSYSGTDVRGPLWSMQGTSDPLGDLPTGKVLFKLRAEGAAAVAKPLAEAALEIKSALPEVATRKPDGFAGALFAVPPGEQKRPALILLAGSEGCSMITRDAPHFASYGYAVLALPYYSPPQWGSAGQMPAELPDQAGHFLSGTGTGPTTHYNSGSLKNGGTPEANARTQAQAHANLLAFLDKHLGQCSGDFSQHGIVLLVACPKTRP